MSSYAVAVPADAARARDPRVRRRVAQARHRALALRTDHGGAGVGRRAPRSCPASTIDAPTTISWEHANGIRGVWDITLAPDLYLRSDYYTNDERWEVTGRDGIRPVSTAAPAGASSSRASRSTSTARCAASTRSTTTGPAASGTRAGTGCAGCTPATARCLERRGSRRRPALRAGRVREQRRGRVGRRPGQRDRRRRSVSRTPRARPLSSGRRDGCTWCDRPHLGCPRRRGHDAGAVPERRHRAGRPRRMVEARTVARAAGTCAWRSSRSATRSW